MSGKDAGSTWQRAGGRLWRWLASRWLKLLILVLLAGTVWWVGPLLSFGAWRPLNAEFARGVVITGLAALFVVSMRLRRPRRRNRRAGFVVNMVSIATALILIGLFGGSFYNNKLALAQFEWEVGVHDWSSAPHGEIQDQESVAALTGALPTLDALADLERAWRRDAGDDVLFGFGHARRISDRVSSAYRRGLAKLLLPFVVRKLEQQLEGSYPDDFTYQALRVYLMLGEPRHRDGGEIAHWMRLAWTQVLSRDEIERLDRHLASLFDAHGPVTIDDRLVERVRVRLRQVPTAVRLYAGISAPAELATPAWRLTDQLDDQQQGYFVRSSGQALSAGIPGLFTAAGYREFQQLKHIAIEQRDDEDWVLRASSRRLTPEQRSRLDVDLEGLYARDFIDRWMAMIEDLNIAPVSGIGELAATVEVLASSDSPVRRLLEAIVRETSLSAAPRSSAVAKAAAKLRGALTVMPTSPIPARDDARSLVRQAFAPLHRLFDRSGNEAASIDRSLAMLGELGRLLNALTYASTIEGDFFATLLEDPAAQQTMQSIARHASQQPAPLNYWLQSVSNADFLQQTAIVSTRTEATIRSAWQSDVLPLCRRTLAGRYPFVPQSETDVAASDFIRMFAPGAVLDEYWQAHIEPYVDTTSRPYRLKTQLPLDISATTLRFFEQVSTIRAMLFDGEAPTMQLALQARPVALSPEVSHVTLSIGEQRFNYSHGPPLAHAFAWSEAQGNAAITFTDAQSRVRAANTIAVEGPWALFRLFDLAEIEEMSGNDIRATFTSGGRSVSYRFAFGGSGDYPPSILAGLQCPQRL